MNHIINVLYTEGSLNEACRDTTYAVDHYEQSRYKSQEDIGQFKPIITKTTNEILLNIVAVIYPQLITYCVKCKCKHCNNKDMQHTQLMMHMSAKHNGKCE